MKLTLAAGALLLTTGAAFAQGTSSTGTPPVPAVSPMHTTTPPAVMAPPAGSPAMTPTQNKPVVQAPSAAVNTTAQSTSSPNPSAVQTHDTTSRTAAAPVPGRNSFTMGQARHRIAAAGFSHVKGLKKDDQGIWRGTADKDGASVKVALDYQGNVVGH